MPIQYVPYRLKALRIAVQEAKKGVREVGGNNTGPEVARYQSADSYKPSPDTGYAWCDSFCDWCFKQAGRPLTELQESAGVELTYQLAKKLGWVAKQPQPGDLVVFVWSHIGFVKEVLPSGELITVEGNTSAYNSVKVSDANDSTDGVYIKRHPRSDCRAFIRVPGKYAVAVLPKKPKPAPAPKPAPKPAPTPPVRPSKPTRRKPVPKPSFVYHSPLRPYMRPLRDAKLALRLKRNGIVNPLFTIAAARATGLELAVLCAVLEQETGGGHNEFGHDPTICVGWGTVSRHKYAIYKLKRAQTGSCQGVGPMQLTWSGYQDEADKLGGCWRADCNILVGARIIAKNVRNGGLHRALAAYNGSNAYADEVMRRVERWRHIVA